MGKASESTYFRCKDGRGAQSVDADVISVPPDLKKHPAKTYEYQNTKGVELAHTNTNDNANNDISAKAPHAKH